MPGSGYDPYAVEVRDLHHLLKQTSNYDKDERYMATNDICTVLTNGDVAIDSRTEKAICSAILKQLDDTSNDVQSIAVKCLSILVKRCQVEHVESICDRLSKLMLDDSNGDLRDTPSIGLKTAISDMSDDAGRDSRLACKSSPQRHYLLEDF